MLVGGGTGGHITPLLAVAKELKQRDNNIQVVGVIDKDTHLKDLLINSSCIDRVANISAGKFRRYPNQNIFFKVFDFKTLGLNIRDFFRVIRGIFESNKVLNNEQPDIIFIKGGFVGVPTGVVAGFKKIPYITHDSDIEPGLANKLIAKRALLHCVGFPARFYSYPKQKIIEVGVPISKEFNRVTQEQCLKYKSELGIPSGSILILITGGSLGAVSLNNVAGRIVDDLLKNDKIFIIHQTGNTQDNLPPDSQRYKKLKYINDIHKYTGASDIVITRAGSFLAELSAQEKVVIVVPAPQLAGGHQVKNTEYLIKNNAVVALTQKSLTKNPQLLTDVVESLLIDTSKKNELSKNLGKVYKKDAVKTIADLLINKLEK
jgi:UDP-N-acetylglucosamine--N-acetylmuramyl-(pentapeptide) pyrophosphoryl-undecaprenol N-acetylglucosamine transferase